MIVLKRILVPTDFGEASDAALRYGRALARTFGAELHLLHVAEQAFLRATFADPETLERVARRQLSDRLADDGLGPIVAHAVLEKFDSPPQAIVTYAKAEAIDLIVMGTHGHTGAAHLLMGSVAERVVRTAPCPVLTVRHPERDFVVAAARSEDADVAAEEAAT